ncbi:carbon-nitrogen hydrolase [Mycotypha africana]|uniref:carbon-nitrogen hydrolase n=1 Tax=Mycotypha africana TaxID=64632 RepID=UPI002301C1C8|nr:carbon-nitrogen hydrolase [Mycotypha africana]KAI8984763.1 carbon-nitrogen hydrolase [Mycotypha africana]
MLWTGLWCLMARFGPLGDYPAFSTSIVTWPTFAQIVSVGGRSLIDFLMALFGTCTYELMVGIYQHHTTVCNTTRPLLSNVDNEEEEEAGQTANATALRAVEIKHWLLPIMIYCFILSCVLTYGGISINIRKGSFFQVNYPQYVPKTVPVGCVVGPGTDYPKLQLQQDIWFKKSASLAESGAKLIVWSELTTSVTDTEEEVKLIQKAKEFAKQHQVYLGITYAKEQPVGQNKLVLITKEGIIGIDYNKAHPVPGVESQPAGLEVLQYVDTQEFGRIGGGICFDYNFPHFISQASTHHVDVMIQPSWTWGPIGTYHQQGNILRAVENGFTLFRCVSQGVSGIFEPTLDGIFTQKVASLNVQKYLFYLPVQTRVPTMYGLFGDTFGYLCLIMSVSTLVYVLTLKRKKNKIIAGIVFESD